MSLSSGYVANKSSARIFKFFNISCSVLSSTTEYISELNKFSSKSSTTAVFELVFGGSGVIVVVVAVHVYVVACGCWYWSGVGSYFRPCRSSVLLSSCVGGCFT